MTKQKIIKLTKSDNEELNRRRELREVAFYGVETAHRLHYEARERFRDIMFTQHPELPPDVIIKHDPELRTLTYTPKGE